MAKAPADTHPGFARYLGPTERNFVRADCASPVNFVVCARLDTPINASDLRRAIHQLLPAHPLLRCHIAPVRGHLAFLENATPQTFPIAETAGDWAFVEDYVTKECHQVFDTVTGPLFRCFIVSLNATKCAVGMTVHHTVGDGRSAGSLLIDAVSILGGQQVAVPSRSIVDTSPAYDGTESLARIASRMDRWRSRLATAAAAIGHAHRHTIPAHLPARLSERKTNGIVREITGQPFCQLLATSRTHGATLSGTLMTALALGALKAFDGPSRRIYFCAHAADMRGPLFGPGHDQAGLYVSAVGSFETISGGEPFWDIACRNTCHLRKGFEAGMHATILPDSHRLFDAIRPCFPSDRAWLEAIARCSLGSLVLSNIGRLASPVGDIIVESMSFAANLSFLGFHGSLASSIGDNLSWIIGGQEPLLPRNRLQSWAEASWAALDSAIRPTPRSERFFR